MGPVALAVVAVASVIGGIALARKLREMRLLSQGTLSGSSGDPEEGDSSSCRANDPERVSEGKPYTGDKPVKGRASPITFQWTYLVKKHETPGSIAERVTGDSRRYVELLSANSDRRMSMYRKGPKFEINFAIGEFCDGTLLYLPKAWNPWIDEAGNFAGKSRPFAPYDSLPSYPMVDPTVPSAGNIPWPPEAPTGWLAIPVPKIGGM